MFQKKTDALNGFETFLLLFSTEFLFLAVLVVVFIMIRCFAMSYC